MEHCRACFDDSIKEDGSTANLVRRSELITNPGGDGTDITSVETGDSYSMMARSFMEHSSRHPRSRTLHLWGPQRFSGGGGAGSSNSLPSISPRCSLEPSQQWASSPRV